MINLKGFYYLKFKQFTLNITFNFNNKGITFISGPSGTGKTTFLKCIAGLIKPNHGYLIINNKIIQNSNKNIFTPVNKRKIGLIFQDTYLFPHINVIENLKFGYNKDITKDYIEKIIITLKLEKILNRMVTKLSGGEKQRVAIAQVLLTKPNIILLDEPFTSQDFNMRKKIITHLNIINKKFSIPMLCICHRINEIHDFGKKILYINNGKIKHVENIK